MSGADMNDLHKAAGPGAVVRSINAAVPTKPVDPPARNEDTAWPAADGSIAGMLATPPEPRAWLAKNRLLMGRAHVLTGIGGSSKTTLLYHLAMAGVIGRLPWDWVIESTGTALLFLTEDTAQDVHHSLAAMTADLDDGEVELLAERLRVFALAGEDVRLLSLDGQALFENSRGKGLIEKCQQYGDLVFIGLDPALALTEGDEMSQAHQRYLGQFCDKLAIKTGACVVLTTHATKASASAEELTSHQSRGGGGITDAVRGEFVMRTMTQKEANGFGIDDAAERKAHVQLVCTKGNKLSPDAFTPLWLRRGPGGVLLPANLSAGTATEARANLLDIQVLDVLRELSKSATPTLAEWRGECVSRRLIVGISDPARKKQMERTVSRLKADGMIEAGIARGIYVPVGADK
jgi:hypothetical protein